MSANSYADFDDYGLRYLPSHLAEAGEVAELFALMNTDFCEALRAATKTDLLFTSHLSLARSAAFKQGKNQLPEVFRMMFMEVGLRSSVDSIFPQTLMLMARVGDVERALDLVELMRVQKVKAVTIVLILRAFSERGDQIDHPWVDRVQHIAEPAAFGEMGVAVLNAIAGTYCRIGDTRQAILALDRARSIAINDLANPVQSANLASVAYGYLQAGAFNQALDTAMLDEVRVDTTPVFAAIAKTARERGDLAIAQRVVEYGAAIPDWVTGHQGLDANDVFALAAEARKLKNIPLTKQLTKKGRKVANDMLHGGLTALALQAAKEGNKATTQKLLHEAKEKAAEEFLGSWRAEAWLKIARVAQTLGDTKMQDDAMLKSGQAALEDDLWRVHQTLAELAKMYAEIGVPERGVEVIETQLTHGLRWSGEQEWERVLRLLLLAGELNPERALDRLKMLEEQSRTSDYPPAFQADIGMALARAGDEDTARQILQSLERVEAPERPSSDSAKALVLESIIAEAHSIPELKPDAEIWSNKVNAVSGLEASITHPQNQEAQSFPEPKPDAETSMDDPYLAALIDRETTIQASIRDSLNQIENLASLEWVANTMSAARLGQLTTAQDPKQLCISTLTLTPEPDELISPEQLLRDVIAEEARMGDAIGYRGAFLARKLAQAVQGFLVSGEVVQAIDAVREIEYWRLLFRLQVSPDDAAEEGAHQLLFDVSRLHAGALIAIASAATEYGSSASRYLEDALDDVGRIPHESVRFVARVGITSQLSAIQLGGGEGRMAKEKIIYLGPEEELTNVCERLENTDARNIILVIPPQTPLRSHVGWRLLRSRVRELGQDVLIISSDRQIRAVAKAAGFRIPDSLESPPSDKPRPDNRSVRSHKSEETSQGSNKQVSIRNKTSRSFEENELLQLSQKFLELGLQESREEFLATVSAWIPVLTRLGGREFLKSIYRYLPLLGSPTMEMQLPRITPQRDIGGILRTFNLV